MSTTTTNYGLVKPELTDAADITAMNKNWDTIDEELSNIGETVEEALGNLTPEKIGAFSIKDIIPIEKGGTGATTAEDALMNLNAVKRNGYGRYNGNVDELKEAGGYLVASYLEGMSGTFPLNSQDRWYTVEVFAGGTGSVMQFWHVSAIEGYISDTFIRHYNGEYWSEYLEVADASKLTKGTTDLTAGTSSLATDCIHLVYE